MFSDFDLIWCVGRPPPHMRTSVTSTRSKVKVTELPKLRKVHFSRSISSAVFAWISKLMHGGDSMGPGLQLVWARFLVRSVAIATRGVMFSGCLSVRLCVCPSVCACVRPNCERDISWTDGRIATKLCTNVTYGRPTIWLGFQGQRVKGQGHAVMTQKFLWARYLLNRSTEFDHITSPMFGGTVGPVPSA